MIIQQHSRTLQTTNALYMVTTYGPGAQRSCVLTVAPINGNTFPTVSIWTSKQELAALARTLQEFIDE